MGLEGGRFGFSLENGDLEYAINRLNAINHVKVIGVHLHNSTKTRSLNIYKTLAKKACEISKLFNYELSYIDIGGGFFGGLEFKPSYYEYMKVIENELSEGFDKAKTTLIVEPGAAVIASPISFLCEVIDVKDTYVNRIVTFFNASLLVYIYDYGVKLVLQFIFVMTLMICLLEKNIENVNIKI